jgi:hypothetical protein
MKSRVPLAALVLPLFLSVAPAGASENLLFNGAFTDSLSGWSFSPRVDWSPLSGGAARIRLPESTSALDALVQCVEVNGGALYDFGAATAVPFVSIGQGGLSIRLSWFSQPGCLNGLVGAAPPLEFDATVELFQAKSRLVIAPTEARSALVDVVARAEVNSSYTMLVDDVFLSPNQFGEILTIPTSASLLGARGQRFATDLWVRNAAPVPRMFSLRLHCPPPCDENLTAIVLNLGPGETRALQDVIFDYLGGGVSGRAGAIELAFDPRIGPLEVTSRVRTSNPDAPGNGMVVPALRSQDRRSTASFIGLQQLGGEAGFRVNAGAYNPGDVPATVVIRVHDALGETLGTIERTWGPHEWYQINDVLGAAGAPASAAASILFDGSAPLYPFVIAVDNRSGDSNWLAPAPEVPRY